MPLAHIISPLSESSIVLAQDLRSRGYDVHALAPDEDSVGSADLEITLTECSMDRALRLAATFPGQTDMSVFVAPRALNGGVRSIQLFILSDKAEREREELGFQQVLAQALPKLVAARAEILAVPVEPEADVAAPVDQDEEILCEALAQGTAPATVQAESVLEEEASSTAEGQQNEGRQQEVRQEVKEDEFFQPIALTAPTLPVEAPATIPVRLRLPVGRRAWILGGTAAVLALAGLLAVGWSRLSPAQADGAPQGPTPSLQNVPAQTIVIPFPSAAPAQPPASVAKAPYGKPAPGVSLAAKRVREKTATPRRARAPEGDYVAPDTVVHVNGNTKAGRAPAKKP